MNQIRRLYPKPIITKPYLLTTSNLRRLSTTTDKHGDVEWNNTWETAWLPEDLSAKNRAPWETDVHCDVSPNISPETKAFVQDLKDNWEERRKSPKQLLLLQQQKERREKQLKYLDPKSLYSLENVKKDYRLKKQRIHAALWTKEIEKQEEGKLGDSILGNGNAANAADDIDKLLDSCSEIFDSGNNDMMNNGTVTSTSSEFKNKPDGWETTAKASDGNVWEMPQREEDILLQDFERRIAYSKFQIASFIKTHIFRKYMIEELVPNARKGKGSVSRLPSVADHQHNISERRRCRSLALVHLKKGDSCVTIYHRLYHISYNV